MRTQNKYTDPQKYIYIYNIHSGKQCINKQVNINEYIYIYI